MFKVYNYNLSKLMEQTLLSSKVLSVIVGSLLGNGTISINKEGTKARVRFRNSISNKNYFMWKYEVLSNSIGGEYHEIEGSQNTFLMYTSDYCSNLLPMYKLVHRKQKNINRKWLNCLNNLGLCIWYCDSGTLIKNDSCAILNIDDFDIDAINLIKKYFNTVWKINIGIIKSINKYRLLLSDEDLYSFLKLIISEIPNSGLLTKFLPTFKNIDIRLRWTSELISESSFSRETILKAIGDRMYNGIHYSISSEEDIVQLFSQNPNMDS